LRSPPLSPNVLSDPSAGLEALVEGVPELSLALIVGAIGVESLLKQVQKSETGRSTEALIAMDQDTLTGRQFGLDELKCPIHHVRVEERGSVSVDHVQDQSSASKGVEIFWAISRSAPPSVAEGFAMPRLLRTGHDAPLSVVANDPEIQAVPNEEAL